MIVHLDFIFVHANPFLGLPFKKLAEINKAFRRSIRIQV
jgi:hypothetical protein